jgi:hypothetical protein
MKRGLRGKDSSRVEVPGTGIAYLPGTETNLEWKEGWTGKKKKKLRQKAFD